MLSAGGRSIKAYRGTSGEVLFDGGSLGKFFHRPPVRSPSAVLVASITYYQLAEVYPGEWRFPTDTRARCKTDRHSSSHYIDPKPLACQPGRPRAIPRVDHGGARPCY